MATERPLRFVGSGGAGNWPVTKDASAFSRSGSLAAEELGLLLEGPNFHGNHNIIGPSRSGSAPPSMEGSLEAFELLKVQQTSSKDASLQNLSNVAQSCKSEEQLRTHPAYLAYYSANVNLNPRLPRPLISRENRHLVHHTGGYGDSLKVPSFDDSFKASMFSSRAALSTHEEETEDDSSPRLGFSVPNNNPQAFSGQLEPSLQRNHKSLVHSAQEDYPRNASSIDNVHSQSSSHIAAERTANPDTFYNPRRNSSLDSSKPESIAPTSGFQPNFSEPAVNPVRLKPTADSPTGMLPRSASSDIKVTLRQGPKADLSNQNTNSNNFFTNGGAGSDLDHKENRMKNLSISTDGHKRSQHARQHLQHIGMNVQGSPFQDQFGQHWFVPQVTHNAQNPPDHFSPSQLKFSSAEVQPVLQSNVIAPPFFAAAAPYGTSYYSNLQPPSLFSPQYSLNGYALNTSIVPPLITGYPHHTSIPGPIENSVNPNFNAGASGLSSGGSVVPAVDMQHLYKIYGQPGVALQPSFPDQLYVPYFQHSSVDAYATTGQYDSMITRGSAMGNPSANYNPQKGPAPSAYFPDQRPQVPGVGDLNAFNARKGGTVDPNYYASSPRLGALAQYTNPPVTRPVFQGSPAAGGSFSGRRNDSSRYPFSSGRSAGSGYQGQRVCDRFEDPKSTSILEELKSNKARRYELSDIAGRIVEFSMDQHGSRFIQQKLETCNSEEKTLVFKEVLPHAPTLMIDVFGNYVIQKFFEHGSPEQRKELACKLADNILSLSLQMYGCRVIQKALEVIELEQKTQLVKELDGHIMQCVRDQNGNHVIQKCIECVPTEKIGFIMSAFQGQVATLSVHPYGCRVIQRVLEHCTDESQSQLIVNEILQSACLLAQDQYGNYVTQHVLERGKPHERSQIISKLAGQIIQLSQHKFASNVIEKCLEYGDTSEKEQLIREIVGQTEGDKLLVMMKDQFANYVVQKILETCSDKQRDILLNRVKVHLPALRKYTYGKHIVARVEQLCGEDTDSPES